MQISYALRLMVLSLLLSVEACAHSVGSEESWDDAGEEEELSGRARLPPFPDETLLCRIVYNESTPAEVAAVLGEPSDTQESGAGSVNYFYDYDAGGSLFVGFLHGVFVDAMVDNAPYPSCWSAEENALNAGLQALRSMPMSNEGGAK